MDDVELKELILSAGFWSVDIEARPESLRPPAPADFLWQYIHGTPIPAAAAEVADGQTSRA